MFTRLSGRVCAFVILLFILTISGYVGIARPAEFEKLERGHFVIYHNNGNLANKLSWKAEYHYKRVVAHFGVKEFRPWENEDICPLYLYKTKTDYLKATAAPEWSTGAAGYHPFGFSSYEDAPNLLIATLPHEMTHMLFYLFMGSKPVPLWLNEGMAQFEEEDQTSDYRRKRFIKYHVKEGDYIRLRDLISMQNVPDDSVELFYSQSASIVDHLITDNIRTNYGRFLTSIKNGDTVEDALKASYQWKYKNGIQDLEKKWLDFVRQKY